MLKKYILSSVFLLSALSCHAQSYRYDASGISREVLENYLKRSITMTEFLEVDPYANDGPYPYKDDDVRLIKNIGAKFIGRAIYRWGSEDVLTVPDYLEQAKRLINKVHANDAEVIFQAALFEIVTEKVNKIPVPAWAFNAMGLPVKKRNFNYAKMLNPDGKMVNHWRQGSSVPDITQAETQLWFMYLAGTYMGIGCEALHLGQTALIGMADPQLLHWEAFLAKLRKYAQTAARHGWVLLDAHVPTGGMVVNGKSLLDFNTFPLRIKELADKPQQAILEVGYLDGLYKRSKGCVAPSGWQCASLPYLVEFDNFGCSSTPGQSTIDTHFIWGYDEITWFYLQSEDYRQQWLQYAFQWVRTHDANGFLQMPVSRLVSLCNDKGRGKYRGNTKSASNPDGLNVEETIKELWTGSQQSLKTIYPTKDWVISDFAVTDFGAKAQSGFDNRAAFQAAIDAAHSSGGGVVYIPAGNYEFRSTQTATRTVRVRQGTEQSMKDFNYQYVLQLPAGVQLRGDWADPELNGGKVLGTILEVRVGKDAPNYDATVESWWNDSQAGNALRTTYTSIADRFIDMSAGTGVTNLSVWYPEQNIDDVKPYPWTLFQATGDCATVENVTLVNAYNGFYSAPSELHYVLNSYMTALNTGIEIHVCTDIGRVENVKIDPKYWANSGLPGAPTLAKATAYTRANGTGFNMHRSDWEYVSSLYVTDYKTGMWIGREPGYSDTPNAQLYEIHIKNCGNGLYVQDVNPYGLLISNSTFGADGKGNAVYFFNDFRTSVQFNGVNFTGPVVSDGSDGVVSFESCTFDKYSDYALKINSGNVLLTQCDFKQPAKHVILGANTHTLKSVNSGYKRKLDVKNNSKSAKVEMKSGNEYVFEPLPKNVKTDIDKHPRPASNTVFKADLARATGFNNDVPVQDVSAELQAALNAVKSEGGGTLYLPAGRYLVNSPVKVPAGVELRGTWDVQHHTQSGGTALFTTYTGGDAGENGASLLQLEENAGIRGLNIVQLNIATDGFSTQNPRKAPFLIQGQGKNVYIVNVTIPVGDKGIDLASYNTGGHYVDYFAGVLVRAGIWVGGGAEGGFIRNMQFNPHYGSRLPEGGQGYPNVSMTRFVQSNCSALKFADVKNQTIFNNFVYGSIYGIHFLKDAITGKNPGQMTVIGHGSDGCTFSLFVEDADKDTKIVAVNSELVNTQITSQPVRSYILMGDKVKTDKVHPDAQLILYNSAFWGSPIIGAIINNGTVRIQQGNYTRSGAPGIDNRGGKAHVYTTYFAQPMRGEATEDNVYARLHETGISTELTNNYYTSELRINKNGQGKIYGFDAVSR